MLAVGGEVAVAHELEAVTGLGVLQAFFQLGVGHGGHAVGVQVILEVSIVRDAVHVGFGEQLVVQADLGVDAMLAADPMDGAAHLAAVGGVAVAGLQVGVGMYGHHVAGLVLVHAGAAHQVSAHQAHFAAQGQALELRRRYLKEVAALDPQLLGKGHGTGGGVVDLAVRVVGQVEHLAPVGGIVVNDELDGVQHSHTALGV